MGYKPLNKKNDDLDLDARAKLKKSMLRALSNEASNKHETTTVGHFLHDLDLANV